MNVCRVYSGGLGILAGDHAKSASNLGLPFVGVSLFYRQGYFQQHISPDGWQQERYPDRDPLKMPITLVKDKKGNPIICCVNLGNTEVKFQAWRLMLEEFRSSCSTQISRRMRTRSPGNHRSRVRRRPNDPHCTRICPRYWRRAYVTRHGHFPVVFHMNEGHSAFLTLELVREQVRQKKSLAQAEILIKQHCQFTTHTPVPAGHDRFDRGLMEATFPVFASKLGLTIEQLMRYGRVNPDDQNETFCMTVLALKMSRNANGVSELHSATSREMWRGLYPETPVEKINIGYVTNGVNVTGWTSPTTLEFWTSRLGPKWIEKMLDKKFWQTLETKKITDQDLWLLRTSLRRELVEFVRKRLREQDLAHGNGDPGLYDEVLSPDVLTIGFARRFATYKRAPLFFRDLEWAIRTINNAQMPVQLVFAGKAHPRDDAGKHFIQQIVNLTKRVDLFGKVVFVQNYDIDVARHLVAGADVWLNTPRRPMEASGTSGMKVAIHGGVHCSTMDGWWREAYDGRNGWKIGEDISAGNDQMQDEIDAIALRAVMENKLIPLFYERGKDGIPHKWLKMVRHAMATLIPVYNTDRMVAEYTKKYYLNPKGRK